MAILIDEKKRVLVQGITGREGRARTRLMRELRNERGRGRHTGQRRTKRAWRSGV